MKVLLILPMLAILLARPVATATTPAMRNSGPAPLEMKFKLKGFPSGLFWKQLANKMGMTLIRFDMSEYQEKHSVARLIGAPPGYVGFDDDAGQLINKLQETPNAILLLDEIEKAHKDVSNILLQFMDKMTNIKPKVQKNLQIKGIFVHYSK